MHVANKTSTTARTSTTVLAADPDLQITLEANKIYRVRGNLVFRAGAACAYKWALSTGSASIVHANGFYIRRSDETELHTGADPGSQARSCGVLTSSCFTTPIAQSVSGKGDSTTYVDYSNWTWFHAMIVVGGTGGTLSLQWAQNTSSSTEPAEVLAGSAMFAEEVTQDEYRQWVVKTAQEGRSRADGFTMYADSEMSLTLEPDTDYWFEGCISSWSHRHYASAVWAAVEYTGAVATSPRTATSYRARHTVNHLMTPTYQTHEWVSVGPAAIETPGVNSIFEDIGSTNSTIRGGLWMEGHIRTDSSGGTLQWVWCHKDNGYGSNTSYVYPGSFLIVEKLNPCTFEPPTV